MSVSGEPITRCPVCRYDLTGLPKNHTCPECGFEYDESMKIWIADSKYRWVWLVVVYFAALIILHIINRKITQVMVDLGLIAWFIALLWIWRGSPFWVITGTKGLVYKSLIHRVTFLAWNQIVFPHRANLPRRRFGSTSFPLLMPIGGLNRFERNELYHQMRVYSTGVPCQPPAT